MTKSIPHLDKRNKSSFVYSNGEKILFEPLFGYGRYVPLPDSKRKIFSMKEITTGELGKNVKEVFANSRVLDFSEIDVFFDNDKIKSAIDASVGIMMRLFEKKNKSSLNKDMMQIPANIRDGVISLRPTKHDRSCYYSGLSLSDKELVYIPHSSSDEEIGEALKLALTRCTGLGAYEFHKKLKALGWEK
jgi:hypothetical protein